MESYIGETPAERQRQADQLREDAWYADMDRRYGGRDTAAERSPQQRRWERDERPALLRELAAAPITDETRDLVEAACAWLLNDARRRRES